MKTDWYVTIKQSALVAFVLLTVWAALQAMCYLNFPEVVGSNYNYVLGMWEPIEYSRGVHVLFLWPIAYSPTWFRLTYFPLAFFLFLVYVYEPVSLGGNQ